MMRLLADENVRGAIVRGLLTRLPDLDLVRAQDVGLRTKDDLTVLEWAAQENRIVLSHDVRTMKDLAYGRVKTGQLMPGLFLIPETTPIGEAIAALLIIIEVSQPEEWVGLVEFVPWRV